MALEYTRSGKGDTAMLRGSLVVAVGLLVGLTPLLPTAVGKSSKSDLTGFLATTNDPPERVDKPPAAPPPVLLPVHPAAPASRQSDPQQKQAQLQWLGKCYDTSSDFCGENWHSAQRDCGPGCFSADFINQKIQECSVKKWRNCDSNFNHSFGYWPSERDRGEIGWAGIYR